VKRVQAFQDGTPFPKDRAMQEHSAMQEHDNAQPSEGGFTLVELLISILVAGILTAVAIVGIGGLHEKGQTAACKASMDAASSAGELYYSITGGTYAQTFQNLTNPPSGQALLNLNPGVIMSATTLKDSGGDWTVTMHTGATNADPTTFSGC
jgi:prepilin-type N-terminal cleavage/methylation domain-containing protein